MKNILEVTKEFKSSMKKADTITVEFRDRTVIFSCIIKEKRGDWTKPEVRKEFTYKNESHYPDENAWFYSPYAKHNTMFSLYYILKIGDKIKFSNMDNSNEYLSKNGLHNDELLCRIYRNEKCIIERMVLESSICENNSARSIKENK